MIAMIDAKYLHQWGGNLTYEKVEKLFTEQGGAEITFKFHHGPDHDNPKHLGEHCILFSNLLEHPLEMTF